MTAGSITYDEFRSLVENFVNRSDKIDDKWHVGHGTNGGIYMCKRVHMLVPCIDEMETLTEASHNKLYEQSQSTFSQLHDTVKSENANRDFLSEMEMESEVDDGCMPIADIHLQQALTYEYHILYSESYNVPVLYFNILKSDGKRLSLEEVWKLCPSIYQSFVKENKWSTLTQQEHPVLGQPYLQLHPCHTSDLMAQVTVGSESDRKRNYLVTWLSTVGPMAGLHISHEYIT